MSKGSAILLIGIWIILLPFLGFPYDLKNILFVFTGIALIYFGYSLRRKIRERDGYSSENPKNYPAEASYSENEGPENKEGGN